ncbi:MAG: peroxiredoxin [Bdellovibrionales bacterium]|nr:peroxiredoxin [Bdellovibrionales bacterium]
MAAKKKIKLKAEGMEGEVDLKDYLGSTVVLYFYPKDNTPGCTQEGLDFSKLQPKFKKAGATVFGVSRDTKASHQKFAEKQKYTIDLIADVDEKACKLFDVIKEKNMYGRKMMGIERSTFVIGPDGDIVKEWRKVRVPGHAQEVLEFVSSMKTSK